MVQILYPEIGIAQVTDGNFCSHNTINNAIKDQRKGIGDHFMIIHHMIFQDKGHRPVAQTVHIHFRISHRSCIWLIKEIIAGPVPLSFKIKNRKPGAVKSDPASTGQFFIPPFKKQIRICLCFCHRI